MMKFALRGSLAALALALAPAAHAEVFNVGDDNFQITNGTPFTPSITAEFSNSFSGPTLFEDSFLFTIPQNGVGSGSISTSFSSDLNRLVIYELWINGESFALSGDGAGQAAFVSGIPIVSEVQNEIRVVGEVFGTSGGLYTGTATFSATAPIPEPATWALLIVGFAGIGMSMRRRVVKVSFS